MLNIVCEARKVSKSSYDLLKNPIESAISRIQPVTSDVMWSTIASPQRKMKKVRTAREGEVNICVAIEREFLKRNTCEQGFEWKIPRNFSGVKKLPSTPGYRPASELSSHKFFFLLPIDEENKLKKKKQLFCDTNTHTWRDKEFHVLARYFFISAGRYELSALLLRPKVIGVSENRLGIRFNNN